MHGGAPGSGAPIGNKNAFRHGGYTAEAITWRRGLAELIRQSRATVAELDDTRSAPIIVPGTTASATVRDEIGKVSCAPSGRRLTFHANDRLWFFSGNERIRLPVALKNALSTAGAATQIVGSPTPPQKPSLGMMTASTFGMSAMRIDP